MVSCRPEVLSFRNLWDRYSTESKRLGIVWGVVRAALTPFRIFECSLQSGASGRAILLTAICNMTGSERYRKAWDGEGLEIVGDGAP